MSSLAQTGARYRPDIDGLRAVAVIIVMAFHAGLPFAGAGFVGVDVFFVISGYLITGIILRARLAGEFSLVDFYLRRTRRILPALVVVLCATTLAGWFLLLPGEYRQVGKHVAGSAAFVSNFLFWLEGDYFAAASPYKPLLHLWSLAVEEQFYLLWPLALMVPARFDKATMVGTSALLAASLATWLALLHWSAVDAFYLLPARAWELMLGALLAQIEIRRGGPGKLGGSLASSLAGGFLILSAAFLPPLDVEASSVRALPAAAGTALLLAAGPSGWANRHVLGQMPLVFGGQISYSLYLWHWPLLAFLRIHEITGLEWVAAALGCSFLLALLTWKFVEIRFKAPPGRVSLAPAANGSVLRIAAYLACLGTIGVAGAVVYSGNGIRERSPLAMPDTGSQRYWREALEQCSREKAQGRYLKRTCWSSGRANPTVALLGDSHAVQYFQAFAGALDRYGLVLVNAAGARCPPLSDVQIRVAAWDCSDRTNTPIGAVLADGAIHTVLLGARFTELVEGSRFGETAGQATAALRSNQLPPMATRAEIVEYGLEQTVERLLRAGKRVAILLQVPELYWNAPQCVARGLGANCDVPLSTVLERQRRYLEVVANVKRRHGGICLLDPLPHLCEDGTCKAAIGGEILYNDNNHLSPRGADYLVKRFDLGQCFLPRPG